MALNREEESEARKDLEEAVQDLHKNPEERLIQTTFSICQLYLKRLEARKVVGWRLRSRIRWKQFSDLINWEFFQAVRECPSPTILSQLINCHGQVVNDLQEIVILCRNYYQMLYTDEEQSLEVVNIQ